MSNIFNIFKDYSWDKKEDIKQMEKLFKLSPTKTKNGKKIKKPRGWGIAKYGRTIK